MITSNTYFYLPGFAPVDIKLLSSIILRIPQINFITVGAQTRIPQNFWPQQKWSNLVRPSARHTHGLYRRCNAPKSVRGCRLPQRCKSVLNSSRMLRGVYWWLVTGVSVILDWWRCERWVVLKRLFL